MPEKPHIKIVPPELLPLNAHTNMQVGTANQFGLNGNEALDMAEEIAQITQLTRDTLSIKKPSSILRHMEREELYLSKVHNQNAGFMVVTPAVTKQGIPWNYISSMYIYPDFRRHMLEYNPDLNGADIGKTFWLNVLKRFQHANLFFDTNNPAMGRYAEIGGFKQDNVPQELIYSEAWKQTLANPLAFIAGTIADTFSGNGGFYKVFGKKAVQEL
jgi:hypothetical protein